MAPLRSLLLSLAGPALAAGAGCDIAGFEAFCGHWSRCEEAPAESVSVDGQCLYARVMRIYNTTVVAQEPMAGAFRRVMFVQGPDAVARASCRHCTPEGRGRMLLNVGWTNPAISNIFVYTIFVRPCGDFQAAEPAETWVPESAPLPATWDGVRLAMRLAYGSQAGSDVWDTVATHYSYAGGGLGPAGIARYGKPFLEVCAFGTYNTAGCCTDTVAVDQTYQALANAFADPQASSSRVNTNYTSAPVLRAFLSNALALNPFFNGDGRTFDGCTGYYSVVSNSEFLMPNKHAGNWSNGGDRVTIGEVTASRRGFSYVWGPAGACTGSATACDAADGTVVNQSLCTASYGSYPASLVPHIFGGARSPCSGRALTATTAPPVASGTAPSGLASRLPLLVVAVAVAASGANLA